MFRLASLVQLCARWAALCAVLSIAACARAPEPVTNIPHTSSFASTSTPTYLLRNNDKLKLLVFGQETISGDYTVSDNGMISISQIGEVQATGLSVDQLEQHLIVKLQEKNIANPQVSVLLDVDQPVFVTGAVSSPGQFPFQPGLDARSAVAMAGGYNNKADTKNIYVMHAGTGSEKRYGLQERPVINPGDVIRVPNRG